MEIPELDLHVEIPKLDCQVEIPEIYCQVEIPELDDHLEIHELDCHVEIPELDYHVEISELSRLGISGSASQTIVKDDIWRIRRQLLDYWKLLGAILGYLLQMPCVFGGKYSSSC